MDHGDISFANVGRATGVTFKTYMFGTFRGKIDTNDTINTKRFYNQSECIDDQSRLHLGALLPLTITQCGGKFQGSSDEIVGESELASLLHLASEPLSNLRIATKPNSATLLEEPQSLAEL